MSNVALRKRFSLLPDYETKLSAGHDDTTILDIRHHFYDKDLTFQ